MITVKKYKKETNCTRKQANIAIKYLEFLNCMTEKYSVCPECGGKLYFEGGSYEEGYDDFIGCNYCDFTSNVEGNFKYLFWGYGFDVVLCNPSSFTPKERKQIMREQVKEWLLEMENK